MQTDVTLKPCPFCGGEAELRGHYAPEYWVGCVKIGCKATTEGFGDKQRAIAAWNQRADAQDVAVLVEALERIAKEADQSDINEYARCWSCSQMEQIARTALAKNERTPHAD